MQKIFKWLNNIGKDKYQHFSLGALIACIILVTLIICNVRFEAANFISIASVWLTELFKEFVLDSKADYKDIIATMLGGMCVWITSSVIYDYFSII